MPFSQSTITAVNPPQYWGAQVYLSWTSSSPVGTWFQIYLDQALSWFGQSTSARLSVPPTGVTRVDIGTVDRGEEQTDFSSSLPVAPSRRAKLTWIGGTFEDPDIAGFQVFGSDSASGPIDYSTVLADITAYPLGIYTDGFGLGRFGYGGFGKSASTYTWISDSLTAGTWFYAVTPYDSAGNLGTTATVSIDIVAPPQSPAVFTDGLRLHYTFNASLEEATLVWNASPG
jgi:hypothetical protein